ncbi:hypothetical protein VST63_19160 [Mycolicibacterium sp. 050232]|uniref:hypothetical protein n=1 Tax=Mycolicibacterium sp. 050232 TaxID=3113982 RepID=UPI002E28C762|nr:hypothetical protein [Mycolicibacterium sp. 050232]MED5814481.1 hypothetical protein [Mycolicibacterium sp. 050232]
MRISLIDPARSACLCPAGLPGYHAVVAITEDGTADLVLVDLDLMARGGTDNVYYDTKRQAPHEQLGRAPHDVLERIWGDLLRCGRPTRAGRPCRIRVSNPGDPCGTHAKPRCDGCGHLMSRRGGTWGCFGCLGRWKPAEVTP